MSLKGYVSKGVEFNLFCQITKYIQYPISIICKQLFENIFCNFKNGIESHSYLHPLLSCSKFVMPHFVVAQKHSYKLTLEPNFDDVRCSSWAAFKEVAKETIQFKCIHRYDQGFKCVLSNCKSKLFKIVRIINPFIL